MPPRKGKDKKGPMAPPTPGPTPESAPSPAAGPMGAMGLSMFAVSDEETFEARFARCPEEHRTWRAKQTKKSNDLMVESWALLKPVVDGRWDKERAYKGLALFAKAMYESQGYAMIIPAMFQSLGRLMQIVQERMIWVNAGGRRVQADDSLARYALRVTFNALSSLSVGSMPVAVAAGQQAQRDAVGLEQMAMAAFQADRCITKLGGPLFHEGTLSGADRAAFEALALAGEQEEADLEGLLAETPVPVATLFLLMVSYDTNLRTIKWLLHYVVARASKAAYGAAVTAPVLDRAAALGHARTCLGACGAMAALDPGGPLAAFMAAEAQVAAGGNSPAALAAMRQAAQLAEQRGDDLMAWLAHLNVAQLLVHTEGGFAEEEVAQAMRAGAAQRSSVKRWGGHMALEGRTRTIKDDVAKRLQAAREAAAAPGARPLPPGQLPGVSSGRLTSRAVPDPLPHRPCAGCGKHFHKTLLCGRCNAVYYCGRECQAAHWRAAHKDECGRAAADAAGEGAAAGAGGGGGAGRGGTAGG